ncbi:MAG: glutamyl-tRNA reductase [Streptosporangiaceae bacterium]|nr:glutamyl-tRNA reductase [Streptosporangiaceae bacterium]
MSVLVVGLSHKSAPVATLERAAVSGDTLAKLLRDVALAEPVAEAFVVSTCNRVEVYADVDRFHAGVTAICELLARYCGLPPGELTPHLYVHYEDRAVSHLLSVACGLDSMVVGDGQILGQVRSALKFAADHGSLGRVLGGLGRLALRTGKRARAETGIGKLGTSLVTLAVELGAASLERGGLGGSSPRGNTASEPGDRPLAGRRVLIVGAGSMSALAAATAARSGAASIAVANRTRRHAERLAAAAGATVADLGDLPAALARADVVISCTGAAGYVITAGMVSAGLAARGTAAGRDPLLVLDLAMPRDVEPAVAGLAGVAVIGMDQLSGHGTAVSADDVAAVRAICEAELAGYHSAIDAARVAPTVVALRAKAATVVDAELARLAGRLSADGVTQDTLDEIAKAVRRVVDKLLHGPTVRVKELAGSPGGDEYAAALRVLFDLDPRAVEAVTRAAPEQEGPA